MKNFVSFSLCLIFISACSSVSSKNNEQGTADTYSNIISRQGGAVVGPSVGSVLFSPDSFDKDEQVTISLTQDFNTDADWGASGLLFDGVERYEKELRINCKKSLFKKNVVVSFFVPDSFLSKLGSNSKLEVWGHHLSGGEDEIYYNFSHIDFNYFPEKRLIEATLTPDNFIGDGRDDGAYEAVLILGKIQK